MRKAIIINRSDGYWKFIKNDATVYESSWKKSNTPSETEYDREKCAAVFRGEGYTVFYRFEDFK